MNYVLKNNESLKKYNTLKIESKTKYMAFPLNFKGIKDIYNDYPKKEKIVLGKGSNILLSKRFYKDDYIFINLKLLDDIYIENNKIYAESGLSLSDLSWYSVENNIKGFEFLEDIPGTIGGAVIMNAGTYNDNIGQLIYSVKYYDINKNKIIKHKVSKSDFKRRTSIWDQKNVIILSCFFDIKYGDYLDSLTKLLEIKKDRFKKQPRNFPNAGSVFKRPKINGEEVPVWKYIDEVGLRGFCKNDAMISKKHTGFIVNKGNAQFSDIKHLIELSKEKVKEKFGIDLEVEWKII